MAKEKEPKFRFARRKAFLTYPRTPKRLTPQVFLDKVTYMLSERPKKVGVDRYIISQELHKEGGSKPMHLHAYLEFDNKLETENSRLFDMEYYNGTYHPKIEKKLINHYRVIRYIEKDPVLMITNIPVDQRIPGLLNIARTAKNDLEYWEGVFYATSMKGGSAGALRASEKLYRIYHPLEYDDSSIQLEEHFR